MRDTRYRNVTRYESTCFLSVRVAHAVYHGTSSVVMASAFLLCGREALISINIQIKYNLSVGASLNRRYTNKGPEVIKVPFGLLPFLVPEEPGLGNLSL